MPAALQYEFMAASLCPTAAPRALGVMLVDEFSRVWGPNGLGGHTLAADPVGGGGGGATTFSALTDKATADLPATNTPLSTALALKANLASPTFTGTVGGISAAMVGLGSVDNTADSAKPVSTAQATAIAFKADLASPTFTGTVGGISAAMVGLGSVNNTADSAKPVSTAQAAAIALKQAINTRVNIADQTVSVTLTASSTVDVVGVECLAISQTTASKTLTLPFPTVTTVHQNLVVENVGTVAVTIAGADSFALNAGESRAFRWNGTNWKLAGTNLTTAQAAAAAVVSGAGAGFPLADAIALGASAEFVELMGTYITVHSLVPVSEAALLGTTYNSSFNNSHVYVDPVNGVDTNTGYSPTAPKRTINTALWTAGMSAFNPDMFLLLKRGGSYDVTSPLGGGSGLSGGKSIGSYGDPTLPRPKLNIKPGGVVSNAGLYWSNADGGKLCDVEIDCAAIDSLGQYHGVHFYCTTNAGTMRNIGISNVKIRAPRTPGGQWPAGITITKRTTENTSAAITRAGQIRIEGCEVFGAGAHGICMSGAIGYQGADGIWRGAEVVNNYVHDCGLDYDAHAITSTGDATSQISNPGWVLVSGTLYYVVWSSVIGRSIADIDMVEMNHYSFDGCTHNFTKNTNTPTAPAVGQFGFDSATQRLYVNAAAAITSTDELHVSGQPPRGVLYAYNRCENMLLQGNTAYTEGAGLQFDDWTSDSMMIGNRTNNNGGAGLAINRGQRNKLVRNFANLNGRCGILTNGHGTIIGGNVLRGGSSRAAGQRGLICQDMINGPVGDMIVQVRRNLFVATSQLDAFLLQTDASGYRGNFTLAAGNQGIGAATQQTVGKVLGF